jgi:hypothetical protein
LLALAGLLGLQQWQQQRDIGRRLELLQLAAPAIMGEESITRQQAVAVLPGSAE